MALVIWTTASAQEVRTAIGGVLANWDGIEIRLVVGPQTSYPKTAEGDVVLAMGSKALKLLQGGGYVPKGRKISSVRETPIQVGKAKYLVTFDPGIRMVDYGMWVQLQIDAALACRIVKTGTHLPEVGDYQYVNDFTEVVKSLHDRIAKEEKPVIAVDLETLTLDPYNPDTWIVSISVTPEFGKSYVIRFKGPDDQPEGPLLDQIDAMLNSKNIRLRGANWKYDSVWLRQKWGLASRSFIMDTTLVGSILDENRSNSLETHAKLYTSMGGYDSEFNKKYNKARMDLVPEEPLLQYAGGDTDATFRVSQIQARLLGKDKKLKRFYQEILHPASIAFEAMERTGVLVDPPYFAKLQTELSGDIKALNDRAMSLLPRRLRLKYADNLSLTRSKILVDFLFTPKGLNLKPQMFTPKAPENPGPEWAATSEDHLNMFANHPDAGPFIQMLQEYSKAKRTLSTYVVGFMGHLRADGRAHPTAVLYRGAYGDDGDQSGTVTGRLAFRDPAFQCMVPEALVLTDVGEVFLLDIVEGHEAGKQYRVKTHTGAWRDVVGVYRNGAQPVYRVRLASGREVICTGNHPLLTTEGFVRADQLGPNSVILNQSTSDRGAYAEVCGFIRKAVWTFNRAMSVGRSKPGNVGMSLRLWSRACSTIRKSAVREHHQLRMQMGGEEGDPWAQTGGSSKSDVPQLVLDESTLFEPQRESVPGLWWARYYSLRAVAQVRELLRGYGGRAQRILYRTIGRERGLRTGELHLARTPLAEPKHPDSQQAVSAGFVCDPIESVERIGSRETFDLTIDSCHSFVADGVVVHNTLPKHTPWAKKLRKGYPAPPGYVIVSLDYSQGELRVTACVANEPNMIRAYRANIDMHLKTGAQLNGISLDDALGMKASDDPDTLAMIKKIRQGGKAGNFGLIYGMSAAGYQQYAYFTYGVSLTLEEAEKQRTTFLTSLYPGLTDWHAKYKAMAHKQKFVRSPLGRVRHLPLIDSNRREISSQAERQSINSPIQSCLSDMSCWALGLFHRRYGEPVDCQAFMMTHDQLGFYVKEDMVGVWRPRIQEVMECLPFDRVWWAPQLEFVTDCEIGYDLASMQEAP